MLGPFSGIKRALGIAPRVGIAELQDWEELIFDSCTLCGRCTLACPMGIDIAELVKEARHGMFQAGLLPERLAQIAGNAKTKHSPFGEPADFIKAIHAIEAEFSITLPLDNPKADLLLTLAPGDLDEHQKSVVGILDSLDIDWTLSSVAFEATSFGYLSGDTELQGELTCRLIDKAREIGADHFVTSCGQCRLQFDRSRKETNWDKEVESLLELVAANMITN